MWSIHSCFSYLLVLLIYSYNQGVEMKNGMDDAVRTLTEEGLIQRRPEHVIMPLKSLKVNKVNYAPMVKSMLEVEKEI